MAYQRWKINNKQIIIVHEKEVSPLVSSLQYANDGNNPIFLKLNQIICF